ncbi:DUF6770 family protein [Parasediminibacterium sp. JCM 36343]|uniref:DUF6770 family protein n=1 Tax=Parasediminibacterium sp. JCM 36343 TaxID=3374279 RepID=UPI00397DB57E
MKLKHLCMAALLLMGTSSYAQNLSFDKVNKAFLRNQGTIIEKNQIKGYFLFYQSDKIDRKTNEYTLQILDQNLNKVKEIQMEDSKDIQLLEAAFNGDALSFLFNNPKTKEMETRIYGLDGKLRFAYTKMLDKKSEEFLKSYQTNSEDNINEQVFSVDNKGFITILPVKDGKVTTYEVEYNSSAAKKQWVYTPETGEEKYEHATFLSSTDSVVILEVTKRQKLTSSNATIFVVGVNFETKKKVFEIEEGRDNYTFLPEYCTKVQKTGEIMLIGPYYDKTANITKDFSLGVGIYTLSNDGKITSKTYNTWAKDISKYLPLNDKGKIDDIGYLFFHNIIQASNGNFYVVGEGYKRVADAFGIGLNVLMAASGRVRAGGNTKIKITDMVVLEFGPDFKINGATIKEKHHSNFHTDYADFGSQHALAQVINAYGAFDYDFTLSDKDVNTFSICYDDYEHSDDYKGETFNIMRYNGSKFVDDKITLSSKATKMKVFPAKPGYVMIWEYYKKEKKIDLRLEKIG